MNRGTDSFEELGRQIAEELGQGPPAEHLFWQESAVMSAAGKGKRPRWRLILPVTATSAAVFCLLILLVPADEASFGYRVKGGQPQGTLVLLRSAGERLPVDFDDGSRIELMQDSGGKIIESSSRRVVVRLEHGKVLARVRNVPEREWLIQAGDFEVKVVGTEFDVSWLPETGSLEVSVARGTVLVGGPGLGEAGRRLTAGERLTIAGDARVPEPSGVETVDGRAVAMAKKNSERQPVSQNFCPPPSAPAGPAAVPAPPGSLVEPGAAGSEADKSKIMAWKLLRSVGEYSSALQTADGVILVGTKVIYEPERDPANGTVLFAMKLDPSGKIIWQKQYAPLMSYNLAVGAVESEGGAVVALTNTVTDEAMITQEDIMLVKIGSSGEIEWQKIVGSKELFESSYAIKKNRDGTMLFAGNAPFVAEDGTVSSALAGKLTPDGTLLWQKMIRSGVVDLPFFYGSDALETADGGVVLVGSLYEYVDPVAVLKLDAQGRLLWQKAIADGAQGIVMVEEAPDGALVVVSEYYDAERVAELEDQVAYWGFLVNLLDPDGGIVWQRLIAPRADEFSTLPRRVLVDGNGNIFVLAAGWSHNDAQDWSTKSFLLKFDRCGQLLWQKRYGYVANESLAVSLGANDVAFARDGSLLLTGSLSVEQRGEGLSLSSTSIGLFLMKTGPDGSLAPACPLAADASLPIETVEYLPVEIEMQPMDVELPVRDGGLSVDEGPFGDQQNLCGIEF